jgi:hypothetical protein
VVAVIFYLAYIVVAINVIQRSYVGWIIHGGGRLR